MSRSPQEQMDLVDRLGLVRAAYAAAKQAQPESFENAASAALAALHGVTMGDNALSSWQGGNPGDPARLAALVEGCGLRARPLRQARGWGYQRLSALGTIIVLDAAPPPPARLASTGSASTLAMEMSDGAQRLVVNCGGPGGLRVPRASDRAGGRGRDGGPHSDLRHPAASGARRRARRERSGRSGQGGRHRPHGGRGLRHYARPFSARASRPASVSGGRGGDGDFRTSLVSRVEGLLSENVR